MALSAVRTKVTMATRQVTLDRDQRSGATMGTVQPNRIVITVQKCHLKNSFQSCGKTRLISTLNSRTQKSDAHSESDEEIFVHSVDTETGDKWFASLSVNGTVPPLKMDTGP